MSILIELSRLYAIECHAKTNHYYDGKPYSHHLSMVVDFAEHFIKNIPEVHRDIVIAACWAHDVIEDCRETYNDVKAALGPEVAEIVYALTNEKGRNRKERANEKYYQGIRETQYASFIKGCDRAANLKYSIDTNSRMTDMYRKEMPEFIVNVFGHHSNYTELQHLLINL